MGLFTSEKTKQERAKKEAEWAKAQAAEARARNKQAETEAVRERAYAKQVEAVKKAELEEEKLKLKEKELLMKMSPEEREAYLKSLQDAKIAELELQKRIEQEEEEKRREEEFRRREMIKNKQEAEKAKKILITKTQHYEFEIYVSINNVKMFNHDFTKVKGSFAMIDYKFPYVFLKLFVENVKSGLLSINSEKKLYEVEIALENIYNCKLKKSIFNMPKFSFSLIPIDDEIDPELIDYSKPLNNYQILKNYTDDKGEITLLIQKTPNLKKKEIEEALEVTISKINNHNVSL